MIWNRHWLRLPSAKLANRRRLAPSTETPMTSRRPRSRRHHCRRRLCRNRDVSTTGEFSVACPIDIVTVRLLITSDVGGGAHVLRLSGCRRSGNALLHLLPN